MVSYPKSHCTGGSYENILVVCCYGTINTIDFQKDLIPEWRAQKKFTFPILVGATEAFLKETYNQQGNPTNMLVNANGKGFFKHVGYEAGGEKVIEAEIREMLGLEPFEVAPVESGHEEKTSKQN